LARGGWDGASGSSWRARSPGRFCRRGSTEPGTFAIRAGLVGGDGALAAGSPGEGAGAREKCGAVVLRSTWGL
jgi:hypothetical protein